MESSTASSCDQQSPERDGQLKNAKKLAVLTIIWNTVESICAIAFGLASNSVSLMAYGIDGTIETVSASVLFWRMRAEEKAGSRGGAEKQEKIASRIVGFLLLFLCVYICIDSGTTLIGIQDKANPSWPGVALTALGLLITPFLARGKWKCSDKLDSGAQRADAVQSVTSCWLGLTALLGLLGNAWLGWSWADPIAALFFIPIMIKEGVEAIRS